mmetsp:Transcript_16766/g.43480  ORF Transcript_16766/g.43480 Transcript_16766/m.43480 type:complete len:281 (-) Transcript_16766:1254-2096(-)
MLYAPHFLHRHRAAALKHFLLADFPDRHTWLGDGMRAAADGRVQCESAIPGHWGSLAACVWADPCCLGLVHWAGLPHQLLIDRGLQRLRTPVRPPWPGKRSAFRLTARLPYPRRLSRAGRHACMRLPRVCLTAAEFTVERLALHLRIAIQAALHKKVAPSGFRSHAASVRLARCRVAAPRLLCTARPCAAGRCAWPPWLGLGRRTWGLQVVIRLLNQRRNGFIRQGIRYLPCQVIGVARALNPDWDRRRAKRRPAATTAAANSTTKVRRDGRWAGERACL